MQSYPDLNVNAKALELVMNLEMPLSISFGSTELDLAHVLDLAVGSSVELNRAPTDLVEVLVNGAVIARGELVVVDGNYGVRIKEIASAPERLRTAGWLLKTDSREPGPGVN